MSKTMASRLVASLRQARGDDRPPPVKTKAPATSRTKAGMKAKSRAQGKARATTRASKVRVIRGKAKRRTMPMPVRARRRKFVRGAARFARQNDQSPPPTSLDRPWENLHPERIWPD